MLLRIFVSIFLLLGITNPVMGNLIDIAISGFVFGLTTYYVLGFFNKLPKGHKNFLITSVVLLVTSWTLMSKLKGFEPVYIYSSLLGYLIAALAQKLKILEKSAIWTLVMVFLLNSLAISSDLRTWLSLDIPYNNDPGLFLETYRQVENGTDYYEAFKNALLGRFDQSLIPQDVWSWRLPTIFYFWKFLPGNSLSIYFLYLFTSAAVLFTATSLAKKFLDPHLAFLSAYLIFPYLHFGSRDQMFLVTEWWAAFLFIFAIFSLIKNKQSFSANKIFPAAVFLSLTLMIREMFILPVSLLLIYSIVKDKKLIPVFLIPIFLFLSLLAYHVFRASDYIDAASTLFSARTVPNGFFFLQQTLAFASWEYALYFIRPFVIMTIAASVGGFYLLKDKKAREAIILLVGFLPFPIAFLRFGTVPYNDYWGIVYVPTAIILSPLFLRVLLKKPIQN